MNSHQLTIIIPVYNENPNLRELAEKLKLYLKFTPLKTKIRFIDDGSTDGSDKTIENICLECPNFSFIRLVRNYGLSSALKAGIDNCDTHWIGYMDADLQTSPQDFMLFFKYLDQYNMVTGIRADRKDHLIKKISSRIANLLRQIMIRDGIKDSCCPLKIIETHQARQIPFFKGMHRFLPALIQLQGGKVKQVEVRHFPRLAGQAKYHLFNRLINPFFDTMAFVWMKKRHIDYILQDQPQNVGQKNQKRIIHE